MKRNIFIPDNSLANLFPNKWMSCECLFVNRHTHTHTKHLCRQTKTNKPIDETITEREIQLSNSKIFKVYKILKIYRLFKYP